MKVLATGLLLMGIFSSPLIWADDTQPEQESEDAELDLGDDFDLEDAFDDTSFDDLEFEEIPEQSNWFLDTFSVELKHSLTTSKLAGWDFIGNQSSAIIGWSDSLHTSLYGEFEGQLNVFYGDDANLEDEDVEGEGVINTAFFQTSLGNLSARAGYFVIGWGEVEGSGVLDVINPSPAITSSGGLDITGDSQLFVSGNAFLGQQTLSAFVNLRPEFTEVPGFDEPDTDDLEFGLKFSTDVGQSDVSFYLASLLPNQPSLNPESLTSTPELTASPYQLIGISANKPINKLLLKLDVALKNEVETLASAIPLPTLESTQRIDLGMGLEYSFDENKQITAALFTRHFSQYEDNFLAAVVPLPDNSLQEFEAEQTSSTALLAFSDAYLNTDLTLELALLGSINGEMLLLTGELAYQLNDRWKVSTSALTATADEDGLFAQFDGETRLSATVSWSN